MSKRILSMFLVVVMLIVAVPVFALPSFAGEKGGALMGETGYQITSTLKKDSDNWPTITDNAEITSGVGNYDMPFPAGTTGLFGEGWSFVNLVGGKTYPCTYVQTAYGTLMLYENSGWAKGILYLTNGTIAGNANATAGFAYTAPYTGKVDVTASLNVTADIAGKLGFGIVVDNVLVYPKAEGETEATFETITAAGTFKKTVTLDVKAGQSIAILYAASADAPTGKNWGNGFEGTVTYKTIEDCGEIVYKADTGALLSATDKIIQYEKGHKDQQGVFSGYNAWAFGDLDYYCNFTEFLYVGSSHEWIGDEQVQDKLWEGGHGGMQKGKNLAATGKETAVALQYTAEFSGKIGFSVSQFEFMTNCTSGNKGNYIGGKCYYTVLVNGEVVWPANCESHDDIEHAFVVENPSTPGASDTVKAAFNEAMADIAVNVTKGDTVQFVQYRADDKGYQDVVYAPCVTYTSFDYKKPLVFSFVNAEKNTSEQQFVAPTDDGIVYFDAPEAEDAFGWFEINAKGEIVEASAYNGTVVTENKTFYAFSKTATLAPGKSWPVATANGVLYPSTITFGKYNTAGTYTPMNVLAGGNSRLNGGNEWGTTGSIVYLNENRFINTTDGALTIRWTALVDGKVEIDFTKLSIDRNTDLTANADNSKDNPSPDHSAATFAIVKNGVIVWPSTAANTNFDLSEGLKGKDGTWFYADIPDLEEPVERWSGNKNIWVKANTGNLMDKLNACLATDAIPEITVEAGDQVEIVFARTSTPHISANVAVTYTDVTIPEGADKPTLWSEVVTKVPFYTTIKTDKINMPTFVPGAAANTVAFNGNWEYVGYPAASNAKKDGFLLDTVINTEDTTKLGDAFYAKNGGGLWDDTTPTVRIDGNGQWGATGSISVPNSYVGGLRYTAEFSGLVDIDLSSVTTLNANTVAIGVFVDGQMIWPTAGNNYTDVTKWYALTGTANCAADIKEHENASALKNLLVGKGSTIEILISGTGAEKNGLWNQRATAINAAIEYASLSTETLDAQMYVGHSGKFFATVSAPYVAIGDILPEGAEYTFAATVNGEAVELDDYGYTIAGIHAKNLVDEFTYSFTLTYDGKTQKIASGTYSPVAYLYDLMAEDEYFAPTAANILNYASAAQTYFGYKTTTLANAKLDEALKALPENNAESVLKKDALAEGTTAKAEITGFTLLIQDKVIIKTFISAEDVTGLKLRVLKEEEIFDWDTFESTYEWVAVGEDLDLTACVGGDGYKAFFAVDSNEDYKTAYKFQIVDADENVVSTTVTYSVATYINRKADSAAADLLKALLATAADPMV